MKVSKITTPVDKATIKATYISPNKHATPTEIKPRSDSISTMEVVHKMEADTTTPSKPIEKKITYDDLCLDDDDDDDIIPHNNVKPKVK